MIPNAAYLKSDISNNQPIIYKAISLKLFKKEELISINKVRISLQMIFISDLVEDARLRVNQETKVERRINNRIS